MNEACKDNYGSILPQDISFYTLPLVMSPMFIIESASSFVQDIRGPILVAHKCTKLCDIFDEHNMKDQHRRIVMPIEDIAQ